MRHSQPVNTIEMDIGMGRVALDWNDAGKLLQIRLRKEVPTQGARTLFVSKKRVPFHLISILEQIRRFCEEGVPISTLPWDVIEREHWTDFQTQVYLTVALIPHGETRSYAWISERIGNVFAHRAVGQALRKNPLPILIPCHRVVSSHGGIGGFLGKIDPRQPEVQLKERLIQVEDQYRNPTFTFLRMGIS